MIKVILNGLGAVGQNAGRLVVKRPYLECVAAVDIDSAKIGKDLGEVLGLDRKLGVKVSSSIDSVIAQTSADIVFDATCSLLKEIQKILFTSIKAGLNFVSICEELGYPAAGHPELAHEIDELAKSHSVTVLGTGINPGFIQDLVPLFFTGPCEEVKSITEMRAANTAGIGATALSHAFCVGESPEEFERRLAAGTLIAHTGHPEQIMMIADALGWKIADIRREKVKSWVSKTRRQGAFITVEPSSICSVEMVTTGYRENGAKAITLGFTLLFEPSAEAVKEDAENGLKQGDFLSIEGEPNIEAEVKGITNAVLVTAAHAVNAIPYVVQARPGLLTQKDFPPFAPVE